MKKFLLITFILGFSLVMFAQETIYFPAFETINVHFKHQYVTSKLFKNYVDANGNYKIILADNLSKEVEYSESFEETKSNALRHKTSYFILSDMSAIGNLLIVNMKMYNTASGEMIWSDALKADELEDLDPVIHLLANALGSEEPAVKAGDIYSVTQYESKELNKRRASESWGITIGGGAILGSDIKNAGISGFGLVKSFDSGDFILDIKAEIHFGERGTNTRRIGMNILKPVSKNDMSLFYGGGIYYGGMSYEKPNLDNEDNPYWYGYDDEINNSGLEIEGNFGVILNRLSSIQLRATVSPMLALYKMDDNITGAIRFGITANF